MLYNSLVIGAHNYYCLATHVNKDFDKMAECQKIVNKAMRIYTINSPYIPVMKRALNLRGLNISEYVTPPFIMPDENQEKKLVDIMKDIGLL